MISIRKKIILLHPYVLIILLYSITCTAFAYENNYLVGRGIYDVTGPAAEVGLMGYANLEQKSSGIHSRQWSRSFVFSDPSTNNRTVFVSVDAGSIFQSVFQGVIQELKQRYAGLYTEENVVLSATHTHAAVGGQSHYGLYDITTLGFIDQAYRAQVDGIVASIVMAHNDLKPGYILLNKGDLENASYNRSSPAYANNPAIERNKYVGDIQKEMILLKVLQQGNKEVGMISWFATHPNAMGPDSKLLSGDNKGYASYLFERKLKQSTYQGSNNFVAAFAINNAGDMSPNINPDSKGRGPTSDRFENVKIIGERQYQTALSLYQNASEQLVGPINFAQRYVDLSDTQVANDFTGEGIKTTCVAALGEAFAAGTEDGGGVSIFKEGNLTSNSFIQFITSSLIPPEQKDLDCHAPKLVLLAQGKASPYPWSPEVLPLSLQTIGQLGILAVPAEFTVMAGRRLMTTVEDVLPNHLQHTVIAALSNAYSGYVTTKEEYDMQHYEGGSTHFGPWTLAAYQQSFYQLAASLLPVNHPAPANLSPITFPANEPVPRDLTGKTINFQTGVFWDQAPIFKRIGDTVQDAQNHYQKGNTVEVKFWSGHPKNNLRTQDTFMEVQYWINGQWKVIATDNDWQTKYRWQRIDGFWGTSHAILTWDIPSNAQSGQYRLIHYGNKSGSTATYVGQSQAFLVQ